MGLLPLSGGRAASAVPVLLWLWPVPGTTPGKTSSTSMTLDYSDKACKKSRNTRKCFLFVIWGPDCNSAWLWRLTLLDSWYSKGSRGQHALQTGRLPTGPASTLASSSRLLFPLTLQIPWLKPHSCWAASGIYLQSHVSLIAAIRPHNLHLWKPLEKQNTACVSISLTEISTQMQRANSVSLWGRE